MLLSLFLLNLLVTTVNRYLLTLIGLALLCAALSDARADVKGIPFDERFATASFPYARQVEGCTAWRRPATMTNAEDRWGAVSFAGACQDHDRCYHTPGASWGECNGRFLEDLKAACARDLKAESLSKTKAGEPDAQALSLCHEIANLYAAKVGEATSAKRYALAQQMAGEYLDYVRTVVDGIYKELLRRGATAKEQDQALATLARDYSLDDLKAALMGVRSENVSFSE